MDGEHLVAQLLLQAAQLDGRLGTLLRALALNLLYLGEGDAAWYAAAESGAVNEKMTAWYEEIATTYAVSINEKALNKIAR